MLAVLWVHGFMHLLHLWNFVNLQSYGDVDLVGPVFLMNLRILWNQCCPYTLYSHNWSLLIELVYTAELVLSDPMVQESRRWSNCSLYVAHHCLSLSWTFGHPAHRWLMCFIFLLIIGLGWDWASGRHCVQASGSPYWICIPTRDPPYRWVIVIGGYSHISN